jgi:hypothetical protein
VEGWRPLVSAETNGSEIPCTSFATRRSLSSVEHKLLMPARGWLGSSAEEGRAKLR